VPGSYCAPTKAAHSCVVLRPPWDAAPPGNVAAPLGSPFLQLTLLKQPALFCAFSTHPASRPIDRRSWRLRADFLRALGTTEIAR